MPFALINDEDLPVCVILGANVMKMLDICLDFGSRQFSFIANDTRISREFLASDSCVLNLEFCFVQDDFIVSVDREEDIRLPLKMSHSRVCQVQDSDGAISKIKDLLSAGDCDPRQVDVVFRGYVPQLYMEDGLLFFRGNHSGLVVVSRDFAAEVALVTHLKMSHPGRNKLTEMMKQTFWHPSIGRIVQDICSSCDRCQRFKNSTNLVKAPVVKLQMERPFQLVALDLLNLGRTSNGNLGCLVVVNHYTKWASIVPIKNKRAENISRLLEHVVLPGLPRIPERILSDNGPEFTAKLFTETLAKYDIEHVFSTPWKPASNGAVERLNRSVVEMIRTETAGKTDWDLSLPKIVVNYNNSVHSALGVSPSAFLLGKNHSATPDPVVDASTRRYWNEGSTKFESFKQGDLVLKKVQLQGHLCTNKMKPRYEGPYVVETVHQNNVTYILKNQDTGITCRGHHSQLKKYESPPQYIEDKLLSWHEFSDRTSVSELPVTQDSLYYDSDSSSESENESVQCEPRLSQPENVGNRDLNQGSPMTVPVARQEGKLRSAEKLGVRKDAGPSFLISGFEESETLRSTANYFSSMESRLSLVEESMRSFGDKLEKLLGVQHQLFERVEFLEELRILNCTGPDSLDIPLDTTHASGEVVQDRCPPSEGEVSELVEDLERFINELDTHKTTEIGDLSMCTTSTSLVGLQQSIDTGCSNLSGSTSLRLVLSESDSSEYNYPDLRHHPKIDSGAGLIIDHDESSGSSASFHSIAFDVPGDLGTAKSGLPVAVVSESVSVLGTVGEAFSSEPSVSPGGFNTTLESEEREELQVNFPSSLLRVESPDLEMYPDIPIIANPSTRVTRSQGRVTDLPYVQSAPIEYKRNRK